MPDFCSHFCCSEVYFSSVYADRWRTFDVSSKMDQNNISSKIAM